ncbi:MAG TPA: histidine kinase [Chitinophagaceae bacterium]|nr:histidine kinase [Chitinophagaceae bacterium]
MKRERFADIYFMNGKTKTPVVWERMKFYLWVALAWTLLWLFAYLVSKEPSTFWLRVPNELWRNIYLLSINILFFEGSWPFILKKRKYLVYNILVGIFLVWVQMMLMSYGLYGWRHIGVQLGVYTPFPTPEQLANPIAFQAQAGFGSMFFFGVIKHVYDYRKLKLSAQLLRIQKQEAELNYLKSQTNPHFLFNTLNNIYSLARDKSDLAPESIVRLSKILRYMLYEAGGEFIAIEQEIKIINDYIALEKLRYDESLRVNFNHDIEDMKQALPPLLLMPLVENAFKHGVSETRSRPYVNIHIAVNKRQLMLTVKNSTEQFVGESSVKENIGLSNLRRQLELLYTDYSLSVRQAEYEFTAILKINLASHV